MCTAIIFKEILFFQPSIFKAWTCFSMWCKSFIIVPDFVLTSHHYWIFYKCQSVVIFQRNTVFLVDFKQLGAFVICKLFSVSWNNQIPGKFNFKITFFPHDCNLQFCCFHVWRKTIEIVSFTKKKRKNTKFNLQVNDLLYFNFFLFFIFLFYQV